MFKFFELRAKLAVHITHVYTERLLLQSPGWFRKDGSRPIRALGSSQHGEVRGPDDPCVGAPEGRADEGGGRAALDLILGFNELWDAHVAVEDAPHLLADHRVETVAVQHSASEYDAL